MISKNIKVGMLAMLLIIPTFVFLFLQFFGDNHYTIKTYYPLDVKNNNGVFDTTFYQLKNFSLTNQENKKIDFYQESEGKYTVLNFFFSRCPGICPKITSQMARVQERFKESPDISLLSVTVDPEFDTVGVLKNYAKRYAVDSKKWNLLTGDKMDIFNLGFYGVKLPADTIDKTLHSERVVLIDKNKHIRGYYNGTKPEEIDRLMTEISILQYEDKNHGNSSK